MDHLGQQTGDLHCCGAPRYYVPDHLTKGQGLHIDNDWLRFELEMWASAGSTLGPHGNAASIIMKKHLPPA